MKRNIIAILIGIAVLSGCQSQGNNYEALFTENFKMAPNTLVKSSRSDVAPEASELGRIMANYDKGEFEAAIQAFDQYLTANPDYYEVKFYRGVTYLKLKNIDKAIADLQDVASSSSDFGEQAEWYLALSLIRSQKKDEAVKLLESMVKNNASQGEKASFLLEKIEEWPS